MPICEAIPGTATAPEPVPNATALSTSNPNPARPVRVDFRDPFTRHSSRLVAGPALDSAGRLGRGPDRHLSAGPRPDSTWPGLLCAAAEDIWINDPSLTIPDVGTAWSVSGSVEDRPFVIIEGDVEVERELYRRVPARVCVGLACDQMTSTQPPLRLAIVDDYAVVVAGVASFLKAERIEVVETGATTPVISDVDIVLYDTFGQVQGTGSISRTSSATAAAPKW